MHADSVSITPFKATLTLTTMADSAKLAKAVADRLDKLRGDYLARVQADERVQRLVECQRIIAATQLTLDASQSRRDAAAGERDKLDGNRDGADLSKELCRLRELDATVADADRAIAEATTDLKRLQSRHEHLTVHARNALFDFQHEF